MNNIQVVEDDWKTMTFPRRKKSSNPTIQGQAKAEKHLNYNNKLGHEIRVKIFDATSGKFLETKMFKYKNKNIFDIKFS